MKFTHEKASDMIELGEIEIETLKDLQELSERYNDNDLVISFDLKHIWIYDSYLE